MMIQGVDVSTDMLPGSALDNLLYCRSSDAVFLGKCLLGNVSNGISNPDVYNVVLGEL